MQTLLGTIAVLAALAIVAGIVWLIGNELRQMRARKFVKRLSDAEPQRNAYARFDQDQMLRNRSERWE